MKKLIFMSVACCALFALSIQKNHAQTSSESRFPGFFYEQAHFMLNSVQGNESFNIIILPNPTTGVFTINASEDIVQVLVTDQKGKLIKSAQPKGPHATIDITASPAGAYIVQVRMKDSVYSKVVIKK